MDPDTDKPLLVGSMMPPFVDSRDQPKTMCEPKEERFESDWDTSIMPHVGMGRMIAGEPERRHSGWEAVERRWTEKESASRQRPTPQKPKYVCIIRACL
jgi:hypothetical protein